MLPVFEQVLWTHRAAVRGDSPILFMGELEVKPGNYWVTNGRGRLQEVPAPAGVVRYAYDDCSNQNGLIQQILLIPRLTEVSTRAEAEDRLRTMAAREGWPLHFSEIIPSQDGISKYLRTLRTEIVTHQFSCVDLSSGLMFAHSKHVGYVHRSGSQFGAVLFDPKHSIVAYRVV